MADGSLIFDTELDNDGFERGSDKLISAVDTLAQRVDQLGANMKESFSGIASILQSLSGAASKSAGGVSDSSQRAADAAERMANAQSRAAASHTKAAQSAGNYDKQLASIQKQIDKAKEKLEPYYEKLEQIHEFTDEALQYAQTDNEAGSVLDSEQEQINALNAKYEERLNVLKQLEAEYARVAAAREAAESSSPTGDETTDVPGGIEEMSGSEEAASGSSIKLTAVLTALGKAMQTVGNHARSLASKIGSGVISALRMLGSAMQTVASQALSLGKRIGQISFNVISSGVKKAVSSLRQFAKQANKTTLTSNALVKSLNSIRTMLIRRVKRMFISAIFSSVQEGIQRLAQFSSSFNDSMSRMKNAMTQLSGSVSIGIGNLLAAFEPAITRIISLVNSAISALNQLFALLRGKTTFTAAKQGADSFASAAGGAAGAAKKLMHELYSYDELTRQSDNSGGGGGGGGGGGIEYEELPIDLPEWIQDWVKRLREAFEAEQWYELGKIIAEGINKGLEIVDDWINQKFRPWAVKWAKNIAEILNGVVDGLNWELLGKTFADGINAIFDAANTFLTTFNWDNLGRGIGRAVKSWFDNIEWDLLGQTFANKWNALIKTIRGIVTTPGIWESIGRSIATFIKNWFATIDVDAIADTFIAVFNGITKAVKEFLDGDPFKGVPEKIFKAINRVIHEVDWVELAGTLTDLYLYCIDQLRKIVAGIDWESVFANMRNMAVTIARKLIEYIGSIDWNYVAKVFARGLSQFIAAINDIVSDPSLWTGIGEKIAGFVKSWFSNFDLDAVVDLVVNFINGVSAAIRAFLDGDPFEGVADKISSAINRLLHEIKWDELMSNLGELFIKLLGVFLDVVNQIDWHAVGVAIGEFLGSIDWVGVLTQVGTAIFNAFKGIIEGMFSTGGGRAFLLLFAAIKGLGLAFTLAKGALALKAVSMLAGIFAPISAGLTTTLPGIIAAAGPAITAAITGLGVVAAAAGVAALGYMGVELFKAHQEMTDAYENEINTAFDCYAKLYNERGGDVAAQWAQMCYGIEATGEDWEADMRMLANRLSELTGASADDIYNHFMQNADKITGVVEGAGDQIEASVEGNMQNIESTTGEALDSMGQNVDEHLSGVKDSTDQTMGEIGQSMETGWDNAAQATAEKTANLEEDVTSKLGNIAKKADETVSEIGSNMPTGWDTTAQTTAATTAAMESDVSTKMDSIVNKTDSAMAEMGESVPAGFDGITQNVSMATEAMETEITTRMESISTKISESMTSIGEGFQVSWDGVTQSVAAATTAIETDVTTKMTAIATEVNTSLTAVGTDVTTNMTAISTSVSTTLTGIGTDVTTNLNSIATGVTTTLTSIGTAVSTNLTTLSTNVNTTLTTVGTSLSTSLTSMSTNINSSLTSIQTNLTSKLSAARASIQQALSSITSNMTSSMSRMSSNVNSNAQQMTSNFIQKWRSVVPQLNSALQSMVSGVNTAMTNMQNKTVNTMNAIKNQPWQSVGRAIVDGIAQGINNGWPYLENLVRQRAQQLLNEAKASLGINSPSKLFREQVGENIGLGWAEGIEDTKDDVINTVENISDAISNEAADAQINADANVLVDGMQTVIGGLSEVATTFKTIADTLAGIGGFKMPQIAEGTVVPYQAKAAANAAPAEDDTDSVTSGLNSILAELQSLAEIVRTASNGQSIIKVLIDGREVFNAVVAENNRAIQRTGASPIRV